MRAGAIIPQADYEMQSTADYNPARYTVHYYPVAGVDSEYSLYDDNRMSASSLADGQYRLINFKGHASADGKLIRLDISATGDYEGAPVPVNLNFKIHGLPARPESLGITRGSAKMGDYKDGSISAKVVFFPAEPTTLFLEMP